MCSNSSWLFENIDYHKSIHEISAKDLENDLNDCWKLKDFKQIASYNWKNDTSPTIIVPGAAHLYAERGLCKLSKNYYKQMVDENRYRQPDDPLESLFRAVQICSPEFKFNNIDFVTDRNNLRKLFNFTDGTADESFRIDIQKIGGLIAFIRNDELLEQFCDNYGKDFEEKFTTKRTSNDPDGSHRRIVKYKFGDHDLVVRFEVDCIDSDKSGLLDDLTAAFGGFKINSSARAERSIKSDVVQVKRKFDQSDLSYIEYGEFDDEAQLMELTTKSNFGGVTFPSNKWNQLFFSNTNYLVVGWHQKGMLKSVQKFDFNEVTIKCNRTRQNTAKALNNLNDLLRKIKCFMVKQPKNSTYSMIFSVNMPGKLMFYENKTLKIKHCEAAVPEF